MAIRMQIKEVLLATGRLTSSKGGVDIWEPKVKTEEASDRGEHQKDKDM